MLTADGYGNAGAYFNNSSNQSTARNLGLYSGFLIGRSKVSVYSVIRMDGQGLSPNNRASSPSAAIVGWCGPRPVAFPLVANWNFDTPLT